MKPDKIIRTTGLAALVGATALTGAFVVAGPQSASAATMDLPIGVQLFTMRDAGTTDEQLAAVERAGINYVETFRPLGDTGNAAQERLGDYGLTAISAHVGLDQLRNDLDNVIAYNRELGNDTIVLPSVFGEVPEDAQGWEDLGTELRGIAERLDAEGLKFAFHNHAPAMAEFDGRTGMEILLDAGGPLVKGQLDLAWVQIGGQDPVEILDRLAGQLISVHAKDVAPEDGGPTAGRGFAAVGEGILDWDAILPAADAAGVEWYIIEHDSPPDAEVAITIGAEFLRERLPGILDTGPTATPIPVPAALPLLAGGFLTLGLIRRRAR